jgi:hypothetical protein
MAYLTGTQQASTFASQISFAFDIGAANANKKVYIYARVTSSTTTQPTTCTVGGNSATAVAAAFQSNISYYHRLYEFDASSASGSQTIVVNYDNGSGKPDVLLAVYDDAGTLGNYATSTNISSTTPSWSYTTSSGRTCVCLSYHSGNANAVSATDGTKQFDAGQSSNGIRGIVADILADSSSESVSLSTSGAAPTWTAVLFDITAVGGGGAVPRMSMMGFG